MSDKLPRSIRTLIALAVLVLSLLALLLVLTISESTLTVQSHLENSSPWLRYGWWGLMMLGGLLSGWLVWRVLNPRKRTKPAENKEPAGPSEADVHAAIEQAEALGADTSEIRNELAELRRRKQTGQVHVALFGEISTGKSSLINALLPDVEIESGVRGGTTRELTQYRWQSPAGDQLLITDMPGTEEADGTLDRLAADEAKRAHIVIYVTDSDINRAQDAALRELMALNKPLVLVLNKTDRYSEADAQALSDKLQRVIAGHPHGHFVRVSAATQRQLVRLLPDGGEQIETRNIAPQVTPLGLTLQRILDSDQHILDELRDSATFVLASQQLDEALAVSRKARAEKLVDQYSVKAVVGALAALTPGSDILIQGWLGTQMIKELSALYDIKVRKVDTDLLLELVQKHVGRAHTLLLAVAGNALKAFPGVGTLAGGALHAVAYGIIFRTLGRALTTTLATRGELHPRQTAQLFKDTLGENMETSARGVAKLVVQQARDARQQP
ncbi:GTPase [Thiosocius teredinicola]|uniref:GTPase n=1 Tax=Thiosocius teredinicola TaxID=1973002 RepID=UPI000990C362